MKCPSCGGLTEVDGKSCSCGWGVRKKLPDDRFDKQCVWRTDGYQCQNTGHLSDTTHGGGPWYCRDHYARLKGWPAWQAAAVDEPMSVIDARVNAVVQRHTGESEHAWSMRCREFVLNRIKTGVLEPPRMREPGEDLEEMEHA